MLAKRHGKAAMIKFQDRQTETIASSYAYDEACLKMRLHRSINLDKVLLRAQR